MAKKRLSQPKNKQGRIISVDLERQVLLDGRGNLIGQPNHRFEQKDVFEYLHKAKPKSIKVIQDAYLLDYFLAVRLHEKLVRGGIRNQAELTEFKKICDALAKQFQRVLVPNGRAYILLQLAFVPLVKETFKQNGFEITSSRKLTPSEIDAEVSQTAKIRHASINRPPPGAFIDEPAMDNGSFSAMGHEKPLQ